MNPPANTNFFPATGPSADGLSERAKYIRKLTETRQCINPLKKNVFALNARVANCPGHALQWLP